MPRPVGKASLASKKKWPAEFDCAGDIYADRWPMGHPVIMWAFGIPFVAVYANYYVMSGSSLKS
ncbi:hypothetical protein N7471_007769 [Penicillium samsonianum]|uniref:uncharacterized protein n=1 Tax=Penicillium samsonianum TaxID=1882272 RepID=UPI0025469447|nr:uncharacterized protein N7471_007769 [Penicillium samsonianum]KAJ6132554.1 hypothetical protein N7471_007769 [Penicillium samsonianum]